jgi:5-methylcytosine-specific restriction endonuclease McrA
MGWYDERFTPHPNRLQCACRACGRAYWLPACEVPRRVTCGRPCAAQLKAQAKAERQRACLHCRSVFVPRTTQVALGQGLYCSLRCSTNDNRQLWSPQARARAAEALRAAIASGRFTPPSGPAHQQWSGGPEATRVRCRDRNRETLRAYRKANPHKVREFTARRHGRKLGRLPRGTVQRIGQAQRWKCAVCRASLKAGYHLDHVMPLALGGEHLASNVQLLCPTCNVRKAAKDPLQFMRERGYLL